MVNIFQAFGLSASAGLNAYIPLLMVAIAGKLNWIQLNKPYDALTEWWVIGVLVVLLIIEMIADKVPAVDTINDVINTIVRPVAGAILFAANTDVITGLPPAISIVLGLFVAGSVHVAKATARPVVTATTAGVGNPFVSILEDIVAAVTSLIAILIPWLVVLICCTGIVIFLWWRFSNLEKQPQKLST